MKILFVTRSTTLLYNYKNILRALCARGHKVHAIFGRPMEKWTKGAYMRALDEFVKNVGANFTYELILHDESGWGRSDGLTQYLSFVRSTLTYRRFLKVKTQSSFCRDRYRYYVFPWLKPFLFWPFKYLVNPIIASNAVGNYLNGIENSTPPDTLVLEKLQELKPDVVMASAGDLQLASVDVEYLKAANFMNIPTVFPVISWDFLSVKGFLVHKPKLLLAWNEGHVRDAITHHDMPRGRIKITGASVFDDWFGLKPFLSLEKFCEANGLDKARRIATYLGSSHVAVKNETWLIGKLRAALDKSEDEKTRNAQLIVRPHPMNYRIYKKFSMPGVFILPKGGALPDTKESFQLFYDTLYYSTAVFGVSTSAFIESMIMDKPVISILAERYKKTQLEIQHFRDLSESGALELARTEEEAARILKRLLDGVDPTKSARAAFVKSFVQPLGLDKPAAEVAVLEIEKLV